jgi:hypothetical protein
MGGFLLGALSTPLRRFRLAVERCPPMAHVERVNRGVVQSLGNLFLRDLQRQLPRWPSCPPGITDVDRIVLAPAAGM